MSTEIVGTLKVDHNVDPNGSLTLTVPVQVPPARLAPEVTLSYHSASNSASAIGTGWSLKGVSLVERTPATVAQDGFRGSINYDSNDRFRLNGQRLMSIGNNEYRYELEQWSKIVAVGSDSANPDSWIEYLPDGSVRTYGTSSDSNIKAQGKSATRVWAATEYKDTFTNYITYSYTNDTSTGAFYVSRISYGGNSNLKMAHQRQVEFAYESRPDLRVSYVGGSKVATDKRLVSITSKVQGKLAHTHKLAYDQAASTGISRLLEVSLQDPNGGTVRPLKFSWINGNPSVFESVKAPVVINPKDSSAQVFPMDVGAKGRSDIVVASKRLVNGVQQLHLDVHEADANGIISTTPSSTFDGIAYPTQLIPLEFDGDGRNDFLHITKSLDSHTLTVLLSKPSGFVAQPSFVFKPEFIGGNFYAGDFEGNGHIGLVYIYQVLRSGSPQIRFVQFTSDGSKFTALSPVDGPPGISADKVKVVVGDLNGDNAEDVFLMSSKFVNNSSVVNIDLLESQSGRLAYRSDRPLANVAQSIPFLDTTSFLPYGADEDGKTSLLVASRNLSGNLQYQMLRSSGPTLLPPTSPITTNIAYSGNVTLARTTSPFSVDIVNTFSTLDNKTNVDVLRFFADSFVRVASVTQPGVSSSLVSWADLRGLGRVDCVLTTQDFSGTLSIATLPCSTQQPIDYVSGYENGLGSKVVATYAPLSDRSTYTTDATTRASANEVGSPLSAVSGLARNVGFTTSLSSSAASPISAVGAQTRSQIVYFPSYVVKELAHTPYAARSDVVDQTSYTYKNARYSYDGRGWQGFESIDKISRVLGSQLTTNYYQDFPLVSQIKNVSSVLANTNTLVQTTSNDWSAVNLNGGKNQYICLTSIKDSYYEGGVPSFDVNVSFRNDDFGNVITTTIQTQSSDAPLIINTEYDNNTSSWVIGNKTNETVTQGGSTLKQTKFTYAPGSTSLSKHSQWIKENTWSTQEIERDAAGNETVVRGPGRALRELSYDPTYSNCITSSVHTSANTVLKETATYDLIHPYPTSTTTPNGEVTSVTYDVLGRAVQTSLNGIVTTKMDYAKSGSNFLKNEYALLDPDQTSFYHTISHIDGFQRVWKTERPSPDNANVTIISESQYDGAGRLTHRARDYFAGSSPSYATATYDSLSRVVRKSLPAPSAETAPMIITYAYAFQSGMTKVTETRSDGKNDAVSSQFIKAVPNPEPSASNFIKNISTEAVDEVGHSVKTNYDGLARPTAITDAADVRLALVWDGLSRVINRSITQPVNGSPKVINNTTALFEDDIGQTTVTNNLTGANSTTKYDWTGRIIEKVTPEDTFTFGYDEGGQYTKDRLVSVSSEGNVKHRYDYDIRGNLISDSVTIDDQTFTSEYTWTISGALVQATNPDGTVIQRSLLPDGRSIHNITLLDSTNTPRASVELTEYNNVFSKPANCKFGNGIIASSSLSDNGTIANMTLTKGGDVLHSQNWGLDSFSRINRHQIQADSIQPGEGDNSFQYNAAGQIAQRTTGANTTSSNAESFFFDQSGNLNQKGDLLLVNTGWQLSEVRNQSGATQYTFKYSDDGNMISKLDASGKEARSMSYNSESRLIKLDGTSFVYDYNGRLIKATLPDGTVRLYPTQSYEVETTAGGDKIETSYIVQGYRRASLTSSGTSSKVQYYHTDHLGSTIAVSDDSGDLITQYDYDPYGRLKVIKGDDVARYKFSGKEMFGDLYYFGARFYDPEIGRFLTLDHYPLTLDGIKPSTFNMYSFSRNDPINYIDLNGNAPWWHWFVDVVLIVVGVAITLATGGLGGIVGSTLIGAGVSGLVYDIQSEITGESNDKDWGIQLGIGAIVGAISGGASAALDAVLPAATYGNLVTKAAGITLKSIAKFAVRTTIRAGLQVGISSGSSALYQVLQNAIDGRPLGEGVGAAAATGAWQGIVYAGMDFQFGFMSKEASAINRFWQKSGSYSLVKEVRSVSKIVKELTQAISNPATQVTVLMLDFGIKQSQPDDDSVQAPAGAQHGESSSGSVAGSVGSTLAAGGQTRFPRFVPVESVSIL